MTLDLFKESYPDFYDFKVDLLLKCVSCATKKPLWFKLHDLKPASGSVIKAVFVTGHIRYLLTEKDHRFSNLGAYMASGTPSGIVAWMPAGASIDNFVKVRLEGGILNRPDEAALHIPTDQEAIFRYRFDTSSFKDFSNAEQQAMLLDANDLVPVV